MQQLTITLPDNSQRTVEFGTRIEEIYQEPDAVGVMVNNQLRGLSSRLETNAVLRKVTLREARGLTMYRRSLSYLLAMAARKVFPDKRLVISHSLGDGYYYTFDNGDEVTPAAVERLESRLRELVEGEMPIYRRILAFEEALRYFQETGQTDTALLLEHRTGNQVALYQCGDFMDLVHVPLVHNTGLLRIFEVKPYGPGFLLRYPSSKDPFRLQPFQDNPMLFSIYQEHKNWGKILRVHSVGRLNQEISQRQIKHFVRVAEALHDKKIGRIADKIHDRRGEVRVVLIAGPSSSGKTTFTKKLAIQLQVLGFNPVTISLDDYYRPHTETPRDENGDYDFEALEAIDVPLLNDHLLQLFEGQEVEIPRYDFKLGVRKDQGRPLQLGERSILIMEGIHGLNEGLTPRIPANLKYKVYVSALTQLNLDDHNRIATTDNRLLRRIVRDAQFRGQPASGTLSMWPSVRRGEEKNIFPHQNSADSAFNTALDYELPVLKVFAEPLLRAVPPSDPYFNEAAHLLNFLDNFIPIPAQEVPHHSILREFIGNSGFHY